MNPALDLLRQALTCVTARSDQHSHFMIKGAASFMIEGADTQVRLQSLTVTANAPGDWFVFCPEDVLTIEKVVSPLLATGSEWSHHKVCDAVLVHLREGRLRLVYIELKSGDGRDSVDQLKSSSCFGQYLLAIARRLHGDRFAPHVQQVEERFITFTGTRPVNRKLTRRKRALIPSNTWDNPKFVQAPRKRTLYLNQLLTD